MKYRYVHLIFRTTRLLCWSEGLWAGSFTKDTYHRVLYGNFGTLYTCISITHIASVILSLETATTNPWRKLFREGIVAIDEVHWMVSIVLGENFRTGLGLSRTLHLWLTASAPCSIEAEVMLSSELHKPTTVKLPHNRLNICICALKKHSLLVTSDIYVVFDYETCHV